MEIPFRNGFSLLYYSFPWGARAASGVLKQRPRQAKEAALLLAIILSIKMYFLPLNMVKQRKNHGQMLCFAV